MSFSLDVVSLTGAIVGTSGTVDWTRQAQSVGFGTSGAVPYLALLNESPCGLQIQFHTGEQMSLPAGGWQTIALNPNCTSFAYSVLYVLNASPIVSSLLGTWYAPGEDVPSAPILGNSPIGASVMGGTAEFLEGLGQSLPLTELDISGEPVLMPGSGLSTKLGLAALNNLGNAVLMMSLDSVSNTLSLPTALSISAFNHATGGDLTLTANNAPIEIGNSTGVSNTPHIDFHSSATAGLDYDSRIIASGGGVSAGQGSIQFIAAAGLILAKVANVAGQPSGGSLGVPVLVAEAVDVAITTLATVTLLSFTPTVTGTYRLNATLQPNNIGAARILVLQANWTDPVFSASEAEWFIGINASTIQAFNATNTWPTGITYTAVPKIIRAKAGSAITVSYQDTSGTPNDKATVVIERIN